jgi:hypothetical protein
LGGAWACSPSSARHGLHARLMMDNEANNREKFIDHTQQTF